MESKIPAVEVKLGFKWQGLLIAVIVGLGIWLIPVSYTHLDVYKRQCVNSLVN